MYVQCGVHETQEGEVVGCNRVAAEERHIMTLCDGPTSISWLLSEVKTLREGMVLPFFDAVECHGLGAALHPYAGHCD